MPDMTNLFLHGRQFYYDRKTPVDLREYMSEPWTGKARYRVRLGTTDLATAQRARAIHNAQFMLMLEKARKAKEGSGDQLEQIDRLALELHDLQQGDAVLPDEVLERPFSDHR